jgi:hypothetical protein
MASSEIPTPVRVAKWCFWILAVSWVALGVYTLVRLLTTASEPKMYMWIVMGLMFANALVMVWLGWGIGRQSRRFFYLAVGYLVFTMILTITDDFGLADLLMLIANVGLLGLLVVTFRVYNT